MPLYINHPITGDQIQVAEIDFPIYMTWNEAMSACEGLGAAWRLPSLYELEAMYVHLHMEGKGDFKDRFPTFDYWSSSEDDPAYAWYFDFEKRKADISLKGSKKSVRAVRAFNH